MATTPVDVIKNLVAALITSSKKITTSTTNGFSGDNAVDEAFKAIGITGGYSALLREFEESKAGYSEQDFLEEVCSIRLNNADTGAITGSDAGGKTIKTVDSIIPENGAAKELTEEEYNTFTKNGLKVNIS